MINPNSGVGGRQKPKFSSGGVSAEHYVRLLLHRKWIILAIFVVVTVGVALYVQKMPNIYSSDTTILVDPQKIPENYVRTTVTGDIRNRLGALSTQILSATRLQKIIDELNLYPEEKKTLAREDVVLKMKGDIATTVLTDFGGGQDLQAFKITYSGRDPRIVMQVANKLATAFIDENLTERAAAANGTTEFIQNQLDEARKALEAQDAKIKDFSLKHIGQMPDQENADLQMLGSYQAQLQLAGESLNRAEEEKSRLQTTGSQSAPVMDLDMLEQSRGPAPAAQKAADRAQPANPVSADRALLAEYLKRWGPNHPDVKRLKARIEKDEAAAAKPGNTSVVAVASLIEQSAPPTVELENASAPRPPSTNQVGELAENHFNPVLQSQLKALDADIAKYKTEQQRLSKVVQSYATKLDAIPQTQQEIASLTRDYEISKAHYSGLLSRKMDAETAAQLEVRQKGEKFEVLDPAMTAERPSRPNRPLYDFGGAIAGLVLGLLCALATEFMGMSITDSQDVLEASGVNVLGIIPVILTQSDQMARRRRLVVAAASATFAALVIGAILVFKMHNQA